MVAVWLTSQTPVLIIQLCADSGNENIFVCISGDLGRERLSYNRIGLTEDAAAHPFRLIPGFHVPEWSKGALMYQIYVDRFCNGDLQTIRKPMNIFI